MTFMISIGSKSNNAPLLSLGIFVGISSYNNVVVGRLGLIGLYPIALGRSGFQLQHASVGAVPQPLGGVLGVGFQTDMGCSIGRGL